MKTTITAETNNASNQVLWIYIEHKGETIKMKFSGDDLQQKTIKDVIQYIISAKLKLREKKLSTVSP